ncbi:hypothetical protein K4F52_000285 [Lecanicillium sp. MT-2017a]|nr:hypothetical protein K4F52_000285 [Lecanicillium sp. MT-2017a]
MKTAAAVLFSLVASAAAKRVPRKENVDDNVCRTYVKTVLVTCPATPLAGATTVLVPVEPSSVTVVKSVAPGSSVTVVMPAGPTSTLTVVKPAQDPPMPEPTTAAAPVPTTNDPEAQTTMAPSSTPKTSSPPPATSSKAQGMNPGSQAISAFKCDGCRYLVQNETIWCVNVTTGAHTVKFENVLGSQGLGQVNALAMGTTGLLYGVITGPTVKNGPKFWYIDAKGKKTELGAKPPFRATGGEFDDQKSYWIMDGNMWSEMDFDFKKDSFGAVKSMGTFAPWDYKVYDWAFSPKSGAYLWALGTNVNDGSAALVRWDTKAHVWDVIKNYGDVAGNDQFGPAWSDPMALYTEEGETGNIYRISLPDGKITMLSKAEIITNPGINDGANCWNYTMPVMPTSSSMAAMSASMAP